MARSNLKESSPSAAAPGQPGASPRWRGGAGFPRAHRDDHPDPLVALPLEKRSWDGCSARCRSRRSRSPNSGAPSASGSAPIYPHPRKHFRLITHPWPFPAPITRLGGRETRLGSNAAPAEMLHAQASPPANGAILASLTPFLCRIFFD